MWSDPAQREERPEKNEMAQTRFDKFSVDFRSFSSGKEVEAQPRSRRYLLDATQTLKKTR